MRSYDQILDGFRDQYLFDSKVNLPLMMTLASIMFTAEELPPEAIYENDQLTELVETVYLIEQPDSPERDDAIKALTIIDPYRHFATENSIRELKFDLDLDQR